MRLSRIGFLCLGFVVISACTQASSLSPNALSPEATTLAPQAFSYLSAALDLMQTNSLNRRQIDWIRVKKETIDRAKGAQDPAGTYGAIRFALTQLNDRHSFLDTPAQAEALQQQTVNSNPAPQADVLEGKIVQQQLGYLSMPSFQGSDRGEMDKYATLIQGLIEKVDRKNPCGWIVDLRRNNGGNMWPMLTGVGPLLGEGRVGAFVDPDDRKIAWSYLQGKGLYGETVVTQVTADPVQLKRADAPVAVLIGGTTASSGEAIVVAFIGRSNTRSFGQLTAGLSTGNASFWLSDGAIMNLTMSVFSDRNGKLYGQTLIPDEVIPIENGSDPTLSRAEQWLAQQTSCQS